jgi:putative hydrolase of the HAD superfamily
VSLGYIPPVSRLKLPPRRGNPWVTSRWEDTAIEGGGSSRGRRGLILDLDDTLYPRERFVMSGFAAVAHHVSVVHGISSELAYNILNRAHDSADRGRELQVLCDRLRLSRDLVPSFVDVFRRHLPSLWLNHEVRQVLHELRASGWRLGVLTNGLPSVQFRKIAALGLTSLVDEIVYAEEHVAGGKPAAAAFKAVLRSLELSAGQCICVGDDLVRDIRGARALGIRTVRMSRPGINHPNAAAAWGGPAITAPAADDHPTAHKTRGGDPDDHPTAHKTRGGDPDDHPTAHKTRGGDPDEADMVIDSLRQLPDAASLLLDTVTASVA